MIIGNGDIASALTKRRGFTFFASGVSNSKETRHSEYLREKEMILKQDMSRHLVYFSTLSVFTKDTVYTRHKRAMEEFVRFEFPSCTIVRVGNITWGNNPNTFINFFKNKVKNGEPISDLILDEYRYVVDKDEFQYWINLIPKWSCEMSIIGRKMKVADVVKEYVT
jgi:hypothetical protein|tara:strand:- start:1151 stop:1648 length:498 start_codon:yes stop_codon:yes gene_type:complete